MTEFCLPKVEMEFSFTFKKIRIKFDIKVNYSYTCDDIDYKQGWRIFQWIEFSEGCAFYFLGSGTVVTDRSAAERRQYVNRRFRNLQ